MGSCDLCSQCSSQRRQALIAATMRQGITMLWDVSMLPVCISCDSRVKGRLVGRTRWSLCAMCLLEVDVLAYCFLNHLPPFRVLWLSKAALRSRSHDPFSSLLFRELPSKSSRPAAPTSHSALYPSMCRLKTRTTGGSSMLLHSLALPVEGIVRRALETLLANAARALPSAGAKLAESWRSRRALEASEANHLGGGGVGERGEVGSGSRRVRRYAGGGRLGASAGGACR